MLLHALSLIVVLASPSAQDPRLARADRQDKNGWVYLHLEGEPSTIGYQYGYEAAPEIDDFNKSLKAYLQTATSKDWKFYRDLASKMYWKKVDPEYKQEILGIAEGLRARGYHYDSTDILTENSWIDFAWYYLPYEQAKEAAKPQDSKAPAYCSAFVATGSMTKDGKPVMAHNAWIDYMLGEHFKMILDIKPTHGHQFMMDSLPGFIHSASDFAINTAGIMITETTIAGFVGFDENGTPEFVRARKAVQYSNNLSDFYKYMTAGNNGGYANTWLAADNKTGEIAMLELGLKNVTYKTTNDGYFVGSNFPQDPNLISQECDPKQWPVPACTQRHTRWGELMDQNKGKIDAEKAKEMLADHYDEIDKKEGPTGATICGHADLDSRKGIGGTIFPENDPFGACNAKVVTADLAKNMSFWGRMGHPCGMPFDAASFLQKYTQFAWQQPYLKDMPTQPWTLFTAKQ